MQVRTVTRFFAVPGFSQKTNSIAMQARPFPTCYARTHAHTHTHTHTQSCVCVYIGLRFLWQNWRNPKSNLITFFYVILTILSFLAGNSVTVFSETSSCRQGHCITGRSLVSGTSWDGNNLCDNSAAASAFSVIAILLMVYYLRLTLLQQLVCGVPSFEGAAWVSFFAGLCSMICVAIWSNWANVMNKEMGDLREKDTDRISFSNLKAGLGVWLQVIAWISLWVNTVLCALASKQV